MHWTVTRRGFENTRLRLKPKTAIGMGARSRHVCSVAVLTAAIAASGCGGSAAPAAPSISVAPTFSVTGTVRDSTGGDGAPVAGATVRVMDGAFAGQSAVTDSLGVYRLLVLSGRFTLLVTGPGYDDSAIAVGPLTGNLVVDARLTRKNGTVSGRVTESAPTQGVPIPGARLRVVNGPSAGTAVTADRDGGFSLAGLPGPADVAVQADGFTEAVVRVDPAAAAAGISIALMPVPRSVAETIGDYPPAPRRPATSFFRNVHNAGSIVVSKLYFYYSSDAANPPTRTIELWDDSRLVAAATINKQQYYNIALDAHVDGGRRYEIRITGGEWNVVTISSPN
jgi:hypothetical protein